MPLSDDARRFLNERRFASLATINPDGSPQLTVMWYGLRGDHIVMVTVEGLRKTRNLQRDGRMALCVEDGYRYVSLSGTAKIIEDHTVAFEALREIASRYMSPDEIEPFVESREQAGGRICLVLDDYTLSEHGLSR